MAKKTRGHPGNEEEYKFLVEKGRELGLADEVKRLEKCHRSWDAALHPEKYYPPGRAPMTLINSILESYRMASDDLRNKMSERGLEVD